MQRRLAAIIFASLLVASPAYSDCFKKCDGIGGAGNSTSATGSTLEIGDLIISDAAPIAGSDGVHCVVKASDGFGNDFRGCNNVDATGAITTGDTVTIVGASCYTDGLVSAFPDVGDSVDLQVVHCNSADGVGCNASNGTVMASVTFDDTSSFSAVIHEFTISTATVAGNDSPARIVLRRDNFNDAGTLGNIGLGAQCEAHFKIN